MRWMDRLRFWLPLAAITLTIMGARADRARAADLLTLTRDNASQYLPAGPEIDGVEGDYILRNDVLTAIIADPHEAMRGGMMRNSGRLYNPVLDGGIIDLTRHEDGNDLLHLFEAVSFKSYRPLGYEPGHESFEYLLQIPYLTHNRRRGPVEPQHAPTVSVTFAYVGRVDSIRYTLADGWPYVLAEVFVHNKTQEPQKFDARSYPQASLQLSRSQSDHYIQGDDEAQHLSYIYDPWRGQAYAVLTEEPTRFAPPYIRPNPPADEMVLQPDEKRTLVRRIFPGRDLFTVRALVNAFLRQEQASLSVQVSDPAGPVAGAFVAAHHVREDGAAGPLYAMGRTDAQGKLGVQLPPGAWVIAAATPVQPRVQQLVEVSTGGASVRLELAATGTLVGAITDASGQPIPAKIAVHGRGDTPTPDLWNVDGDERVRNLIYTLDGRFTQALPPGDYRLVITRGPEYHAVYRDVTIEAGRSTTVDATLEQVVDSSRWISATFANHTTQSRPASAVSVKGRLLNLIAEHVEFAPATEWDRIYDYAPTLREMGARHLLGTAPGAHFTQRNRKGFTAQNVFPLKYVPHFLDGGAYQRPPHMLHVMWLNAWYAPIERAQLPWIGGARKLIQVTPPGIWTSDGRREGEYDLFYPWAVRRPNANRDHWLILTHLYDAIEIQPLDGFLDRQPWDPDDPTSQADLDAWWRDIEARLNAPKRWPEVEGRNLRYTDMINLGYRFTGVVNNNDVGNFHGSSRYRNYIWSDVQEPGKLDALEIMTQVKLGHVVMTTGPLLEVTAAAGSAIAIVGDELPSPDGSARLHIKVQSSNWATIDTVQVLFNGRPVTEHCFTRQSNPDLFKDGPVQFDHTIDLRVPGDTNVIVLAAGRGPDLTGQHFVGPRDTAAPALRDGLANLAYDADATVQHVAMSNPIFIDHDDDGYKPHPPPYDQVYTWIEPRGGPIDGRPGIVRFWMKNDSPVAVSDELSFVIRPAGAVRNGQGFKYKLEPFEMKSFDFEVDIAPDYNGNTMDLFVPRSTAGVGRREASVTIERNQQPYSANPRRANFWHPELVRDRPQHWEIRTKEIHRGVPRELLPLVKELAFNPEADE